MKQLLITGASSGIGYSTALHAARQGWRVIACGRNEARLAKLAEEHNNIRTLAFDVTDSVDCQEKLGQLRPDVVLLNAGTCEYVDVDNWDPSLVKRVFNANFFSVIHCINALLPNLVAGNQLVFVDSMARLLPFTKSQAYGASKAALHYLAKTMDVDLKDKGIVVQTVSPGFVKTPLTDKNTFDMPMRISAEQAAIAMLNKIEKQNKSGFFPTGFGLALRSLSMLPESWKVRLCRLMANSMADSEESKA